MPDAQEPARIAFESLGGAGAPALLIHGFASDRLSWGANQLAWEGVARLSSLDLPGHGESGMDVGDGRVTTLAHRVATLLDEKGLRRQHLIGHSLGGGVALVLAHTRPDLVASLALIAPAGLGEQVDPTFLAAYPDLAEPSEAEAMLHRLVVRPRLIGKPLVGRVLNQLSKPGSREALRKIGDGIALSVPDLESAIAFISASALPRLVLWGEHDAINPASEPKLRAFGGELIKVPDAGHLPQIESLRLVNASVANFLKNIDALGR
jgi:pimeloyl-ACP methyl ester carboxylesterase